MVQKINISIPEKERELIANGLMKLLADTYTLYLKTHNFHWNVTGPMFQTLHIMFMEQYTELWNAIDLIAERIRSLGYFAPGSYKEFTKLSSISEEDSVPKAKDMVRNLVLGHEMTIKTARDIIQPAEAGNDESTLDLVTQRLTIHEKTAWMLRSLLEEE
ncbi:MAG: DNA starvation/stationary phase protection protein [Leptospiraceae bacterium]|jgi:starvation-inducible DNA-binding protein|nr:DNA starvation/stationary phase protection protein [Leptospiraceae bacterium]PJE01628.1 MAG: DNA starvation/stationary phase protection protein [Leptospira sp.]